MNQNDTQMVLVAALCIVVIFIMFVANECHGVEPMEKGVTRLTKAEAIRHLVEPREKYRPRLPYFSKRIKAYKDEVYRTKLAEAFQVAADTFGLPVNLMIALSYRETVFRTGLVGPGGERGILQVMPWVVKRGKKYCEDVDTIEGGALCGAWWFSRGLDRCGDVTLAINAYVSGKCVPTHPNAIKATKNRVWLWQYLNGLTGVE